MTSDGAKRQLSAVFIPDESKKRRGFRGARCELPSGQIVEVSRRRTPVFDLARELDRLGYGEWLLQMFTPTGTPSLRGKIWVMAGLTVEESDRDGLRLRPYRPFSPGRVRTDAREASDPIPEAQTTKPRVMEHNYKRRVS